MKKYESFSLSVCVARYVNRRFFVYLFTSCLMVGCTRGNETFSSHNKQNNSLHKAASPKKKVIKFTQNEVGSQQEAMLIQCEKELTALKTIDHEDYLSRIKVFSSLMAAATQYGSVRSEAAENTSSAIDALYQYRISRLCAGISLDLLNALSDRGEGHK